MQFRGFGVEVSQESLRSISLAGIPLPVIRPIPYDLTEETFIKSGV